MEEANDKCDELEAEVEDLVDKNTILKEDNARLTREYEDLDAAYRAVLIEKRQLENFRDSEGTERSQVYLSGETVTILGTWGEPEGFTLVSSAEEGDFLRVYAPEGGTVIQEARVCAAAGADGLNGEEEPCFTPGGMKTAYVTDETAGSGTVRSVKVCLDEGPDGYVILEVLSRELPADQLPDAEILLDEARPLLVSYAER